MTGVQTCALPICLRKIAEYFNDPQLTIRVENVITEEWPKVLAAQEQYRPKLAGKKAVLFVGGSRAHHYQDLFTELGMETVAAGYEFAHRDDYEGREVIPTIKVDADSRNIEELHVNQDPKKFRPKDQAFAAARAEQGYRFHEYDGMMDEMKPRSLIIDDINHYESEKLIEMVKPDVFCAGIKEKYVVQKSGVPCKQLHSYDYGGPYAGFTGAVNFYAEMDRLVNGMVWSLIKAPWEDEEAAADLLAESNTDIDAIDQAELVSARKPGGGAADDE